MKENCKIIIMIVACLCSLAMQAQEVKIDKKEACNEFSGKEPSLDVEGVSLRPMMLGGYPVLQGKSYFSESQEPELSEDGTPLQISPNAIPKYESSQMIWGKWGTYYVSGEVPGLMDRQNGGFMYRQDIGQFTFSPYVGMEKINTGVYRMGNLTRATFGSTLSYHVNDWLTVGLYGQFVPMKTADPRSIIMSPFMPKSNFGGFLEVMFNQHWGVGAKIGREFVPQKNGKWGWKNTREIYPIYKK